MPDTVRVATFELTSGTLEKIQCMLVDGLMENKAEIEKIRQKPVIVYDLSVVDHIVCHQSAIKDVRAMRSV